MRFLLNDHPDLAVAPETHFLSYYWRRHNHVDLTQPTDRETFWAEFTSSDTFSRLALDPDALRAGAAADALTDFRAMFRAVLVAYAEKNGKKRFGEKTPDHYQHLGTLFEWFPNGRVVFLIRDPRAVVASYMTVNQQWAEGSDAYTLARGWRSHVDDHVRQWQDDPRVRLVRYEQLVRAPEAELRQVLDFAGLRDETSAILNRQPTEKLGTGSLGPASRVSDDNVDVWRSRLTRRHLALIEGATSARMPVLGYTPEMSPVRSRVTAAAERVRRRSRRLVQDRSKQASRSTS
jgi:hypothetical protein